jgi:hypothetical protein
MKAILYSLLAIFLMGGLAGGGLFAHFFDVEQSTANTFTAGTVDIEVADGPDAAFENPWVGPTMELVGIKPTTTYWKIVVVHNVGHNPIYLWKHLRFDRYIDIGNVFPASAPVASSEPEYDAEMVDGVYTPIVDIDSHISYSFIIARLRTATGDLVWGDSVADFDVATGIPGAADEDINDLVVVPSEKYFLKPDIWCYWIGPIGPLPHSTRLFIAQDYHLWQPPYANAYQGDGIEFTTEFYAEQAEGGPIGPEGNIWPYFTLD